MLIEILLNGFRGEKRAAIGFSRQFQWIETIEGEQRFFQQIDAERFVHLETSIDDEHRIFVESARKR